MNLNSSIELMRAGGPGSGCRGPNCGRPITNKGFQQMTRKVKQTGLRVRRNTSPWDVVKTYDAWQRGRKERERIARQGKKEEAKARTKLQKAKDKGKLGPRLSQQKQQTKIDVQPVWKGRVRKEYRTDEGHKVTILKSPKEYEKSGKTWIGKPSPFKGRFFEDRDFTQHTYQNPKERNSFWIHQASPEKGVSIELHRNLGERRVKVVERELGQYDAIMKHRQVEFNNIGRASGFLNRRYGITFRLKQGRL